MRKRMLMNLRKTYYPHSMIILEKCMFCVFSANSENIDKTLNKNIENFN